ncbi:MAG: ATP-binding cassette domain-containing protein, partial [Clostridia bacterium]|nr:ATP-binding cassette domain-containing protein [Clostridia bacterium]
RADIAYGPKNMGLDEEEIERRVLEAAAFAGVTDEMLDKSPFELSGGQKRRAALAGVMAMQPNILILDEPAAGLDPVGRRDILGGIRQYAGESGTTVIIVSHSMEDMAMYCDKLVVMANAKILMHKTCAEVFSEYQELIAVGLDVPQITRIASALAMNGADIGADIYTVDYAVKQLMKKL